MEISEAAKQAVDELIEREYISRQLMHRSRTEKVIQQAINEATTEIVAKCDEYKKSLIAKSKLLHKKDAELGRLLECLRRSCSEDRALAISENPLYHGCAIIDEKEAYIKRLKQSMIEVRDLYPCRSIPFGNWSEDKNECWGCPMDELCKALATTGD